MEDLKDLLEKNRAWARGISQSDPEFFERLSHQQSPKYLWVGCSDSRVPATQLVGLLPGEMFVHRNVANLVIHTDLNCLSVLQYAVDVLGVSHIIVCGHYGCGGVQAAVLNNKLGLIDNWLRHVQDIVQKHAALLADPGKAPEYIARVCELNVVEQVWNLCQTTVVEQAWERGQKLAVHGWIFGVEDGLLRDLNLSITHQGEVLPMYSLAIAACAQRWGA